MNPKQYKTISAETAPELDRKVNEAIKDGFLPYGDPYVKAGAIFQAMMGEIRQPERIAEISATKPTRRFDFSK